MPLPAVPDFRTERRTAGVMVSRNARLTAGRTIEAITDAIASIVDGWRQEEADSWTAKGWRHRLRLDARCFGFASAQEMGHFRIGIDDGPSIRIESASGTVRSVADAMRADPDKAGPTTGWMIDTVRAAMAPVVR